MRRTIVLTVCLLSMLTAGHAQQDDATGGNEELSVMQTIEQMGLPVIQIETVDGEEPTCDYIDPPEGAIGKSITNATKVPGRVVVRKDGQTIYDSGDYVKSTSGMTVKIRGNTSAYGIQKPYKIKLQKKGDMLGRGDSKYNDKNWVLLNSAYSLKTKVGLKLSELMGMQWTPAHQYVNMVFNGEYRGVYILIEGTERNEKCRIDVDENGGYIVEMDPYWWKEDLYFDTNYTNMTKKYTFKYPDADDITEDQVGTIKTFIEAAEKSMENGTYPDYIDVRSFAMWLLAHDILGTWDSGGSNIFVTLKNTDSKLQMGNLWDFDTTLSMKNEWARVHTGFFYYGLLFGSSNTEFAETYKALWEELKGTVFTEMTNAINDYASSTESEALDRSYKRYYDDDFVPAAEQMRQAAEWFAERRIWLDNAISAIGNNTDGIDCPTVGADSNGSTAAYDLSGKKAGENTRGIIISNGRKTIRR